MNSSSVSGNEMESTYHELEMSFKSLLINDHPQHESGQRPPEVLIKPTNRERRAHIINLPHEILIEVVQLLNKCTIDIMVLSQTCRTMRYIIFALGHPSIASLTKAWRIGTSPTALMCRNDIIAKFISRVTRDKMDITACPSCGKTHGVDLSDTPARRAETEVRGVKPTRCILSGGYYQRAATFAYVHVHFLLKYFRHWKTIGPARQRYARDILAPYSHVMKPSRQLGIHYFPRHGRREVRPLEVENYAAGTSAKQSQVTTMCSAYPKVIIRRCLPSDWFEQRVLLKTVRTAQRSDKLGEIREEDFSPCAHVQWDRQRTSFHPENMDPRWPYCDSVNTTTNPRPKGVEHFGACGFCSTDYSFNYDVDGTLTLTTWQDLGGDHWDEKRMRHSAVNLNPRDDDEFWEKHSSPEWYFQRPGSVLEAYEETEGFTPWAAQEMEPRDSETLGNLMFLPPGEMIVSGQMVLRSCEGVFFDYTPIEPNPHMYGKPLCDMHYKQCRFCNSKYNRDVHSF